MGAASGKGKGKDKGDNDKGNGKDKDKGKDKGKGKDKDRDKSKDKVKGKGKGKGKGTGGGGGGLPLFAADAGGAGASSGAGVAGSSGDPPRGVPLHYAHVNEQYPAERFDVEGFGIEFGKFADYKLRGKIGEGAYSEVFLAVRKRDGMQVVAKQIKAEKETEIKLKRELLMLRLVSGSELIVQWLDTVQSKRGTKYFVFEYIENPNFRVTFYKFTDLEARLYLFQLLQALDYTHSQGIIHRDVKPRNVLYNPVTRQLRLIDWGFGEFYFPGKAIEKWPGTRYYKAPELFFRYPYYDYAVDMWSFGCVVATLVFSRMPMFKGREDSLSQLIEISKCLGTQGLHTYLTKYRIAIRSKFRNGLKKRKRRPWLHYRNPKHPEKCTPIGIDLVDKLLRWDHETRLTARDALDHPYFDPVRNISVRQVLTPEPVSYSSDSSDYIYYYDDDDDDDDDDEDAV